MERRTLVQLVGRRDLADLAEVHDAHPVGDGRWFDHPFQPGTPAADHPPLNALVLSVPARLFGGDFMAMRITLCLVGAATIVLVGVLARRFAQRATSLSADRVGLIAAGLTAVYANIWMNDAIMMAESVTGACVAAALVATYVLLDRPAWPAAVALGAVIGLGALARAELTLLGLLVAVPAIVLTTKSWRTRLARTAACAAAALLVIAPWAAYNLTRFDRPTLLSAGEGHVTAGANCPSTYHDRGDGRARWPTRSSVLVRQVRIRQRGLTADGPPATSTTPPSETSPTDSSAGSGGASPITNRGTKPPPGPHP